MAFTPNTNIKLLNVPIKADMKNQLYFGDVESQTNYFNSKVVHNFTDYTYQRKDNSLHIKLHIDELYNCNYVMYQNKNFTNKWFYAFIKSMEYVNDHHTVINIETDVYQTWLFNVNIKPSFVVREHITNDYIGANLIEENLETGEFIIKKKEDIFHTNKLWFIMGEVADTGSTRIYDGNYSGVVLKAYREDYASILTQHINVLVSLGMADKVLFIYCVPDFCIPERAIYSRRRNIK